jgi:hypothetical protein
MGGPKDEAFVDRTPFCPQFDFIVLHDGVWIKFGCFYFFLAFSLFLFIFSPAHTFGWISSNPQTWEYIGLR